MGTKRSRFAQCCRIGGKAPPILLAVGSAGHQRRRNLVLHLLQRQQSCGQPHLDGARRAIRRRLSCFGQRDGHDFRGQRRISPFPGRARPVPRMLTDVQQWLDSPATNFGWIMLGNESSRTNGPAIRRPGSRRSGDAAGTDGPVHPRLDLDRQRRQRGLDDAGQLDESDRAFRQPRRDRAGRCRTRPAARWTCFPRPRASAN